MEKERKFGCTITKTHEAEIRANKSYYSQQLNIYSHIWGKHPWQRTGSYCGNSTVLYAGLEAVHKSATLPL
jgi:hypothetical protein